MRGCKKVRYCSKACQREHWRGGHRKACKTNQRDDLESEPKLKPIQPVQIYIGAAAEEEQREGPTEDDRSKPKEKPKPSRVPASGAAAEERHQNLPIRQAIARVDADGNALSFGKHEDCGICLDSLRDPVHLPCGHWYCKECIEKLRQSKDVQDSCPVCREPLPPGPAQLLDEACQIWCRVERKLLRNGEEWANLPAESQEEMNHVHELLAVAASQGHANAQYNLGVMYANGDGVAQDFMAARGWYEKAATQGDIQAQKRLDVLTCIDTPAGLIKHLQKLTKCSRVSMPTYTMRAILTTRTAKHLSQLKNPLCGAPLENYQMEGLRWLIALYENGFGGALANEDSASGRMQVISWLAFLQSRRVHRAFIITAPLADIHKWVFDVSKWLPTLELIFYDGLSMPQKNPGECEMSVIIASHETVIANVADLQTVPRLQYLIVDEGAAELNQDLLAGLNDLHVENHLILMALSNASLSLERISTLINFMEPYTRGLPPSLWHYWGSSVLDKAEEEEKEQIKQEFTSLVRPLMFDPTDARAYYSYELADNEAARKILKDISGLQ